MGQLVDTSVFIGLERRAAVFDSLADYVPDEPVALSAVTASELLAGVHRANSQHRRLRREAFVNGLLVSMPVVPFDLGIARVHALLWSQLTSEGRVIGAHDMLIAATAVALGWSVLTDNVREFGRVPGLDVRRPDW